MGSHLFCSASQMADAHNYNDWTFSLFERHLRGRVLEVGCGVGTFTRRILDSDRFDSLLSIDLEPAAVAHCRENLRSSRVEFRCVDVRELEGAFNLIVCMNVLEHIPDDSGALARMLRLLAPEGTLFLLVPAHQRLFTPFDAAAGHVRRYSKRHMQPLILGAASGAPVAIEQFYFNTIGAIGYWFVYSVLKKLPDAGASGEIGAFDRFIVPILRRIEGRRQPFGLSLVSVVKRGPAA
jgi:SAM-dependent methyltransferase